MATPSKIKEDRHVLESEMQRQHEIEVFEKKSYICKNNFFVFVLSGCHASTWRDLHRLNLFKQGPLFFWDCLNSSVPGLLQGVTLPFFLSIAFLCFRLKLQPT
ncbi:unnamed protein product, partial [Vitis vinifera]|uniref:Uncharacterized protein n=1 Tax=Vitis vinifera TaxID=29760 RepID=D7SPT3_VITVI